VGSTQVSLFGPLSNIPNSHWSANLLLIDDAKGIAMTTVTGSQTRTILGQLTLTLEYPRRLIERDVDFSNCTNSAHYNEFLPLCINCRFGPGCMWLNSARSADTSDAPLPELIAALGSAVKYIGERKIAGHGHHCDCESCQWLMSARRLLRSLDHKT
jgi:hypothetical protein